VEEDRSFSRVVGEYTVKIAYEFKFQRTSIYIHLQNNKYQFCLLGFKKKMEIPSKEQELEHLEQSFKTVLRLNTRSEPKLSPCTLLLGFSWCPLFTPWELGLADALASSWSNFI
jgi:hypothetical protein